MDSGLLFECRQQSHLKFSSTVKQQSHQLLSSPQVSKNTCAFAIDSKLFLPSSKDAYCEKDIDIDCICCDDSFVFVLSNGGLLSIFNTDLGIIVSLQLLTHQVLNSEKTFLSCTKCFNGFYRILCYSEGSVHYLDELDLAAFAKAGSEDSPKTTIAKLQDSIISCEAPKVSVSKLHAIVAKERDFFNGLDQQIIFAGDGAICLEVFSFGKSDDGRSLEFVSESYALPRTFMTDFLQLPGFQGFRKFFDAGSELYGLDNEGHLFEFSSSSYFMSDFNTDYKFVDFVVKKSTTIGRTPSYRACGIFTKSGSDDVDDYKLGIFTLPEKQLVYSSAVQGAGFTQDSYFISNQSYVTLSPDVMDFERESTLVNVHQIIEITPQERLNKLVDEEKYDMALEFAARYDLDSQQILLLKINHLLKKMLECPDDCIGPFKEVQQCIPKIKDPYHVGYSCLKFSAKFQNIVMSHELLVLVRRLFDGQGSVYQAATRSADTPELELRIKIDRFLDLFITYKHTYANATDPSLEAWKELCEKPIYETFQTALSEGELSQASSLYSRHQNEIIEHYETCSGAFSTALNSLKEFVDPMQIQLFLISFVPPVLSSSIADHLKILAAWLTQRTLSLEDQFAVEWPNNGHLLTKKFFDILESERLLTACTNNIDEVTELRLLSYRLANLVKLRERYKCNLSLFDITKEDPRSLAFSMLDQVAAPEMIPLTIEDTVQPYVIENKLNLDQVLVGYLQERLLVDRKNTEDEYSATYGSIYERKANVIIDQISDKKVKIESVVLVSRSYGTMTSQLSQIVKSAIEDCARYSEDEKIIKWKQELQRKVHMGIIPSIWSQYPKMPSLKKIGCSIEYIGVPNKILLERTMTRFSRYLIKTGTEESIAHAYQIAGSYADEPTKEIDKYRFTLYINDGKIDDCMSILRETDDEAAAEYVNFVVRSARDYLQLFTDADSDAARENYCKAAMAFIHHLLGRHSSPKDVAQQLMEDYTVFKSILRIQTSYDERITYQDYCCSTKRDELFCRLAKSVAEQSSINGTFADHVMGGGAQSSSDPNNNGSRKILALAHLLNVPREQIHSKSALTALKSGCIKDAIAICRDLHEISPTAEVSDLLVEISEEMLILLHEDPEKISPFLLDVQRLLSDAWSSCDDKKMSYLSTLWSITSIAVGIYRNSDASSNQALSQFVSSGSENSSFGDMREKLNNCYRETDGLNLPLNDIMPKYTSIAMTILFGDARNMSMTSPDDPRVLRVCRNIFKPLLDLIDTMLQQQLLLLAFQTMGEITTIMLKRLASNTAYSQRKSTREQQNVQAAAHTDQLIDNICGKIKAKWKAMALMLSESILTSRYDDVELAVGLLQRMDRDQAYAHIRDLSQANINVFRTIKALADAGLVFASKNMDPAMCAHYKALKLNAKWAVILNEHKIPTDGILSSNEVWRRKHFYFIRSCPTVTAAVIWDYCKDYDLPVDDHLIKFADAILCPERAFKEVANFGGQMLADSPDNRCRTVSACTSPGNMQASVTSLSTGTSRPWSSVITEINWVASKVAAKQQLFNVVLNYLEENVSPYEYDKIESLLKVLQLLYTKATAGQISSKVDLARGLNLIAVLRKTTRRNFPSDLEIQHKLVKKFNLSSGRKYTATRLPFHLLFLDDKTQTAWKIISSEIKKDGLIDVSTVKPLVQVLELSEDNLYIDAATHLKTIFQKRMNREPEKVKIKEFLEEFQSLVGNIKDRMSVISTANGALVCFPTCEEKCLAYKWVLSLVQDVVAYSPTKERLVSFHKDIAWSCKVVEVEYILQQNKLEAYSNILQNPKQLVLQLYQHPSIATRYYEPGSQHPDIHSVVQQISDVFHMDAEQLRMSKIALLLKSPPEAQSKKSSKQRRISNQDLELLYLLTYGNFRKNTEYLSRIIQQPAAKVNDACRVRTINWLLQTSPPAVIKDTLGVDYNALKNDVQILDYLTQLREVNFNIRSKELRQTDRTSVIRTLITQQSKNGKALKIAANMCLDFIIDQANIWTLMLQQLILVGEIEFLQGFLVKACRQQHVKSLLSLPTVWFNCVSVPLTKLSPPLTTEQEDSAVVAYSFLMKCPVLLQINLQMLAEKFMAVDLPVLAAGCLLSHPSSDQSISELRMKYYGKLTLQLESLLERFPQLQGRIMIEQWLDE